MYIVDVLTKCCIGRSVFHFANKTLFTVLPFRSFERLDIMYFSVTWLRLRKLFKKGRF